VISPIFKTAHECYKVLRTIWEIMSDFYLLGLPEPEVTHYLGQFDAQMTWPQSFVREV